MWGRKIATVLLLGGPMFFNACAGAAPNPVAIVQPQDRYMDCAADPC